MSGTTIGGIRTLLRLEGFCVMFMALFAYSRFGFGWKTLAIFFFAPDLAFIGYLAGPRVGALVYNMTHSYIGVALLFMFGIASGSHVAVVAGMIWSAHIGFNRLLGYGLKYSNRMGMTHFGLIGTRQRVAT